MVALYSVWDSCVLEKSILEETCEVYERIYVVSNGTCIGLYMRYRIYVRVCTCMSHVLSMVCLCASMCMCGL